MDSDDELDMHAAASAEGSSGGGLRSPSASSSVSGSAVAESLEGEEDEDTGVFSLAQNQTILQMLSMVGNSIIEAERDGLVDPDDLGDVPSSRPDDSSADAAMMATLQLDFKNLDTRLSTRGGEMWGPLSREKTLLGKSLGSLPKSDFTNEDQGGCTCVFSSFAL